MSKNTQNQNTINPEADIELTIMPDFQTKPFVIIGDAEAVMPLAEAAQAYDAAHPVVTKPKPIEAPQAPVPAPNQYIDYSELPGRQIARMKLRAQVYDLFHRTNMYGLVVEKINEDRDVAFARGLGLISTTHCLKHEKAVSKLRGLV